MILTVQAYYEIRAIILDLSSSDLDRQLTEQMIVGLALVLEGQATVRDMVEVLQPLEERDGDTTSIDVQIGDDQNVAINEYFVSGRCGGSVGGLGDDLANKR